MGKKYIIELEEPEIFDERKFYTCTQMPWWAVSEKIVESLTPYTELDLEQVRKEAYQKGLKDSVARCLLREHCTKEAYQQGLNDAWDAARKVADYWMHCRSVELFNTPDIIKIFENKTASEAIEKLKAYEQKKEFKVGDEFENEGGKKFVVLKMNEKEIDRYMDDDGNTYHMNVKYKVMRKTGRHFPEIDAVLEKMRGENND